MLFLVIAYDRPKYLDVTLESVYRIHGIEKHPVMVTVDGGGRHREEVLEVLKKYPVDGYIMHKHNQGILNHITFSVANMMQWGYDEVVYLEEDLVVRPDVLEYLETARRDTFFISLSRQESDSSAQLRLTYLPSGNLVRSDCFFQLVDYVKSGAYIGTKAAASSIATANPERDGFANAYTGHHPVYVSFANIHSKLSCVPPVQYTQHFGAVGAHFGLKHDKRELELFSCPREAWLGNILKEAKKNDIPVRKSAFQYTPGFNYGEKV